MIKAAVISLVLVLSSLQIGMTSTLEDGFYAISQDGSGPPAKYYDRMFRVTKKLNFPVLKSEIRSINNANTSFSLTVTMPLAFMPEETVALFFNGTADTSYSGGSDEDTATAERHFNIDGRKRAEQIAAFLNVKTIYFHNHPQHQLEVSFKPVLDQFSKGQRVSAIFHLQNIGQNTIVFNADYRSSFRNDQYEFSCRLNRKPINDVGRNGFNSEQLSRAIRLTPGETFEEEVDLTEWFAFDTHGIYNLIGLYFMEFRDASKDDRWPIWTDYAAAQFFIKIK
jgi:hypothetical protein